MPKTFPYYGVFQSTEDRHPRPFYVMETFASIDGPRTRVSRGGFVSKEAALKWIEDNRDRTISELPSTILQRVIWFIDILDDGEQPAYRLVQEAISGVMSGRLVLPERKGNDR